MPITETQRQRRNQHIGSSDVAAILGVDRWRNVVDVWHEKTGHIEPVAENAAMYLGTKLEDGVLEFAADKLGPLTRNQYRSNPDLHLACAIDAIVNATGDPVEAKTAGLLGPLSDPWGDDGTDQVPERVIAQCHAHMLVTDAKVCHVPALLGGRGFAMFEVHLNEDLASIISDRCLWFWGHVERGERPEVPDAPTLEVMRRFRREPNKTVCIESLLVEEYRALCRRVAEMERRKAEAQARILEAMGDAEAATAGDYAVTYLETVRKPYAVSGGSYRQMRIKEPRQ